MAAQQLLGTYGHDINMTKQLCTAITKTADEENRLPLTARQQVTVSIAIYSPSVWYFVYDAIVPLLPSRGIG
jgi:hypothetical protein